MREVSFTVAGPWRIFTALPYSPIRRVCKFHPTSAPEPFAYSIVMDILYHIFACFANFFLQCLKQDFQDTDKADASLRFAPLVLFKIFRIFVDGADVSGPL